MRILVLFDLPTRTATERKAALAFRKALIEDGFAMEQLSVYSRPVLGGEAAETHVKRVRESLPTSGKVTIIQVTEAQYRNRIVTAEPRCAERVDIGEQLTLSL